VKPSMDILLAELYTATKGMGASWRVRTKSRHHPRLTAAARRNGAALLRPRHNGEGIGLNTSATRCHRRSLESDP